MIDLENDRCEVFCYDVEKVQRVQKTFKMVDFQTILGWLTLWMAIFADMGATLIVTFNSLGLLKDREDGTI